MTLCEWLQTWWQVGRKDGISCMAYGGSMSTSGAVRVCGKPRGHFDSHAYEFLDVLERRLAEQRLAGRAGEPRA